MGTVHESIDGRLRAFIEMQPVFFVATAPLVGRVNVSPKGLTDSFVVVDAHTVAYLDLTASGAETIAHLRENGRITVMLCSFERTPNVVRLHGTGHVVSLHDPDFARWSTLFPANPAARAVIVVHVERVADSCGYSLPLLRLEEERDLLSPNMARRGEQGVVDYRRRKNRVSIDGLPAYDDDGPAAEDVVAPQPVGEPVPGWTPRPPVAPVALHGRYVDLEPLGPAHADALHDATCGDARRWTYLAEEMPGSRADFAAYVRQRAARPDQAALAIVPRGGPHPGAASGIASWLRCDPANGSVEVGGILFGQALARTAAATEAMVLMASHAFGLGYRRYEWKCDALNQPSKRAARRLGFTFEGVFRQGVVYKGRSRDTAWFSITDADWVALAPAYEQWLDGANFEDPRTGAGQRVSLSTLVRGAAASMRMGR